VEERRVWVDDQREQSEEGDEAHDDAVEDGGARVRVGKRGVERGEGDRAGKVDVRLEERDDFGSRARRSDDEDILRVSQDCVAEEDAKEHEPQGKDLLHLFGRRKLGAKRGERTNGVAICAHRCSVPNPSIHSRKAVRTCCAALRLPRRTDGTPCLYEQSCARGDAQRHEYVACERQRHGRSIGVPSIFSET
jgi:hypothetical protein